MSSKENKNLLLSGVVFFLVFPLGYELVNRYLFNQENSLQDLLILSLVSTIFFVGVLYIWSQKRLKKESK
ncbi:hypothetical protein ACT4R9_01785 [Ornithobacterium rhinotracheale]|uniref:hypothetical protein n=1 Tax=Ornithobacterium rhinotracheale TaxID=28251 RepID=UPI003FD1A340